MKGKHKFYMEPLELNLRFSNDITEIVLNDENIQIPELKEMVLKDDHVFQKVKALKKELSDGEVNILHQDTESLEISREIEEKEDLQQLASQIAYKMRIINPSHGHEEWLSKFMEMCDIFDTSCQNACDKKSKWKDLEVQYGVGINIWEKKNLSLNKCAVKSIKEYLDNNYNVKDAQS